jgi:UDP-galactopyranose mutase
MIDITKVNCIVVGAGFCGSVIARKLAEHKKKVLIFERRNHIAGNMYDEIDANGILVHRYGPHAFHTKNKKVFEFITKYGTWIDYHLQVAVVINGIVSPSPANYKTIDLLYDKEGVEALKAQLETRYSGQKAVTILELLDCDDAIIKKYAQRLYEMNYRPYTVKQWGIPPEEIDPSILKRVPVRLDYTNAYFDDEFQCMPENGYTCFFKNLLSHENIEVQLNTDALDTLKADTENNQLLFNRKPISIPVVYTGAIDEMLEYRYGQLPYRSLRFDYQTKNIDSFQDAPLVTHPKAEGYTRTTEYKKLPPQNIPGLTTVVYEYPIPADKTSGNEPYYPVLTDNNTALYKRYLRNLQDIPNLFLCGRLADYKYYNMDNAILRAFEVFEEILHKVCKESQK